jgi:single-stranded DNA-binding protein
MSLYTLATGTLIADPVRRSGANGDFATATIRAATEDGTILVSAIAFSALAEQLLSHHQGDAVAVAGRAKLREWTGQDGAQHHGLSVTVEQLTSAAAARRADAERRRGTRAAA